MLNFPASPNVGDTYSSYLWDGEKWGAKPVYVAPPATANPMMDGVVAVGTSTKYAREDHKHPNDSTMATQIYVDAEIAKKMAVAGGQTITGGFLITPYALSAGNLTPNPLLGNYQYISNNGAFTITAPANDCALDILVTNTASAGGISFVGFTIGSNVGDTLTTTNGHRFIVSIRRINAISTYVIKALQ